MNSEVVGQIVALGLVAGLVVLLASIVRFSIVSSFRMRNANARIRSPSLAAVERVIGFRPPAEMESFYRDSRLVSKRDIVLVGSGEPVAEKWEISFFIPMSAVDVNEWRRIGGVDGIPFASDGNKGIYYVARDRSVRLASPNVPGGEVTVVANFAEFTGLTIARASGPD